MEGRERRTQLCVNLKVLLVAIQGTIAASATRIASLNGTNTELVCYERATVNICNPCPINDSKSQCIDCARFPVSVNSSKEKFVCYEDSESLSRITFHSERSFSFGERNWWRILIVVLIVLPAIAFLINLRCKSCIAFKRQKASLETDSQSSPDVPSIVGRESGMGSGLEYRSSGLERRHSLRTPSRIHPQLQDRGNSSNSHSRSINRDYRDEEGGSMNTTGVSSQVLSLQALSPAILGFPLDPDDDIVGPFERDLPPSYAQSVCSITSEKDAHSTASLPTYDDVISARLDLPGSVATTRASLSPHHSRITPSLSPTDRLNHSSLS